MAESLSHYREMLTEEVYGVCTLLHNIGVGWHGMAGHCFEMSACNLQSFERKMVLTFVILVAIVLGGCRWASFTEKLFINRLVGALPTRALREFHVVAELHWLVRSHVIRTEGLRSAATDSSTCHIGESCVLWVGVLLRASLMEVASEVGLSKEGKISVDRCCGNVRRSFFVAVVVRMARDNVDVVV